jgi:hypothetical protein
MFQNKLARSGQRRNGIDIKARVYSWKKIQPQHPTLNKTK